MLRTHLLTQAAALCNSTHQFCLAQAPVSPHRDLYQTVVCGQSLPSSAASELFKNTGVIHLLVSQGLHLALAAWFFARVAQSWRRRLASERSAALALALATAGGFFGLALIVALDGAQAPIVRAVVAIALRSLSKRRRLNWSGLHCAAFSCAVCLALESRLWTSLALPLACAGAIGVAQGRTPFSRCAFAFAATAPLIARFHAASFASVFFVWALAPVFAALLFPLTATAFAWSAVSTIADFAWNFVEALLREAWAALGSMPLSFEISGKGASPAWPWLYLLALTASALLLRRARARRFWLEARA